MAMKEHPWSDRQSTVSHALWFRNIVDSHQITRAWIAELKIEPAKYFMELSINPELRDSVTQLERVYGMEDPISALGKLQDDTLPEDLLRRLESAALTLQVVTLQKLDGPRDLHERLERICFNEGRACAQRRWPSLPQETANDMRGLYSVLCGHPLVGEPGREPFLVTRLTRLEARVELFFCPHQSRHSSVTGVATALCELQAHWLRGFLYGLNSRTVLQHRCRDGHDGYSRCVQRWYFMT